MEILRRNMCVLWLSHIPVDTDAENMCFVNKYIHSHWITSSKLTNDQYVYSGVFSHSSRYGCGNHVFCGLKIHLDWVTSSRLTEG